MNTVSLPIVKVERNKITKIGICLWIFGWLFMIYLLNSKIDFGGFRTVSVIMAMFLIVVVPITIAIRRTIVKEYKEIGLFILKNESLTIICNDKNVEYKFSDLKN